MKANEAPEKIYVQRFDVDEEEAKFDKSKMFFDDIWVEEPESSHDYIEYTCTDTFINRACEWLEDHIYEYLKINRTFNEPDYDPKLIGDFRNYIKGE